jgi:hypothetical protein
VHLIENVVQFQIGVFFAHLLENGARVVNAGLFNKPAGTLSRIPAR